MFKGNDRSRWALELCSFIISDRFWKQQQDFPFPATRRTSISACYHSYYKYYLPNLLQYFLKIV